MEIKVEIKGMIDSEVVMSEELIVKNGEKEVIRSAVEAGMVVCSQIVRDKLLEAITNS